MPILGTLLLTEAWWALKSALLKCKYLVLRSAFNMTSFPVVTIMSREGKAQWGRAARRARPSLEERWRRR